jgi:hypothetical protein
MFIDAQEGAINIRDVSMQRRDAYLKWAIAGRKKIFLRPTARLEKAGASTPMAERNRALYVIMKRLM